MYSKKTIFLICLILLNLILGSWYLIQGTINFNTDIARDFLLLEDIVYNHNITLIGPRSGGISGVFHGPLWIYLLVPSYVLGQGNPVVVGWFWFILFASSVFFVYYIGKKLFNHWTGLLSAVLYSVVTASSVHAMFNPFGAVILFPLLFYFFYRYSENLYKKDLVISIILLGTIIQFQMAFGVPILLLILPYCLYLFYKNKLFSHIFILFLILIPLSSFILFDLRHDFLQIKSVITYITNPSNPQKPMDSLSTFLFQRFATMINGSIGMITSHVWSLTILFFLPVLIALRKIPKKERKKYYLFIYLFVGYWILTLLYRDNVQIYYHWPFVTMIAIFFASLWEKVDKRLFFSVFIAIYINNQVIAYNSTVNAPLDKTNDSHWKFFKGAAETVYNDAPPEFGYYVYTNDRFGYSTRYAMNYMQRLYLDKKAYPFEKKEITYLMMSDSGTNEYTNKHDWKKYDIKFVKPPLTEWQKNDVYEIEKYKLTPDEVSIESNPNLIQDLMFR